MRISSGLAITASALSLVLIGCAAVRDDDPTAEAGSVQKAARVGIDAPIRDLLNNPATLAVLQKDVPGMVDNPRLDMVRSMSLRQVAEFPQAGLDAAKLKKIQADLEATTEATPTHGNSEKSADVATPKN
jgi:para-nitrobenzyl esterase